MPRSRGGAGPSRSAPSRPTVPARSAAPQQQQRPYSSTPTAPAQHAQPPAKTSQGSGLFGQMASTAAGVAVGSSIGHAIGGFFGGGSASAPVEQQAPSDAYSRTEDISSNSLNASGYAAEAQGPCAGDLKTFTDCMNQNRGDLTICGWYMDQLKACVRAARQY